MSEKKVTKVKKDESVNLTVEEARKEIQKLHIAVQEGKEKDTTKVKKLKKHIARKLTEINNKQNG